MFTLTIKTENEAFAAWPDNGHSEVARILERVAVQVREWGHEEGSCVDANGNTVGKWSLTE